MNTTKLDIYENAGQLDHDTDMLLDELLGALDARGVPYADALAAIRRSLKGRTA
ncbi:MAG TPA: hypothetical protein VIQ78_05945 [Terrimesophilobacter sp.]|uniref:hypothetical protein n=1 Tax=Terrimesophilobacter sp. TaxID=2906435 RepID=UPI002F943739